MPHNKASAPIFAEGFPMVPRMSLGDTWSMKSQPNKQTNKNKQNKQPVLMLGLTKKTIIF